MELSKLAKIGKKKKKRIGRGYGSCKGGHTVGKGQKGQSSRSGFKKLRSWIRESKVRSYPKLRGIGKRSAKRGYVRVKIKRFALNVGDLDQFESGETITLKLLREKGLVKAKGKRLEVKILGKGEIEKKLNVSGIQVSKTAKKKIEKAGGKVVDI